MFLFVTIQGLLLSRDPRSICMSKEFKIKAWEKEDEGTEIHFFL